MCGEKTFWKVSGVEDETDEIGYKRWEDGT